MTTTDPIIAKLRSALVEAYGPRLQRIVLFGSRARGDARADSDYDVAVFFMIWQIATARFADWLAFKCTSWTRLMPSFIRYRFRPGPERSAPRSCMSSGAKGLTCEA